MLRPVSRANRQMRRRVPGVWRWAVAHNPEIGYPPGDVRTTDISRLAPLHLPLEIDCSQTVKLFSRWLGAPDPTGLGYHTGAGYTGDLLAHLRQIGRLFTRRGDLIIFGAGTGKHVVQLLQSGFWHRDPLVGSHGWNGSPEIMRLSQMAAGFPRQPVRYLRWLPLDYGRG